MADTATAQTKTALWPMIHEQREKLGELLTTLTPQQWEAGSLCADWRVRDAVAHCVETQLMTPGRFIGHYVAAGFRFHAMSAKDVARHKQQPTDQLLAEYKSSAGRSTAPPGPLIAMLGEAVIHAEDIARPLGKHIDAAPATLVEAANYTRRTSPLLHGKQRSAGLKLRATDVEWTVGEGPEVSGPAASLIIALAGRKAGLDDLSGDGVETLRSRIP